MSHPEEPKPTPWRLLPLILLLLVEASAFAWLLQSPSQRPERLYTPLSIAAATAVLLSAMLPALLRPRNENVLAACFGVVFASLLVIPFDASDMPVHFQGERLLSWLPGYLVFRLVNGAWIAPLALHLTAYFPLRSKLKTGWIAAAYLATGGLLVTLLLATSSWLRLVAASLLGTLFLCLIAASFWQVLTASRNPQPEKRRAAQQARLLFFGVLLAETPLLLRPAGYLLGTTVIDYDVILVFQAAIPATLAFAVLRHDLFGIDRALRRAFAYSLLSLLLVGLYLGSTVILAALFTRAYPDWRGLVTVVLVGAAAAAFEPTRRRIQGWIDQWLYPEKLIFRREIRLARSALNRVARQQEVIAQLSQVLPQRLAAAWGELCLPAEMAEAVERPDSAWQSVLLVGGRLVGLYRLGPRWCSPVYDAEEQALLEELAQQAGLALAYAQTVEELSTLNRELELRVAERSAQLLHQQRELAVLEERQRLGRELHDSVTQTLFSMNLSAGALQKTARKDTEAAVAGLADLERAARQALAEMRSLLAQLRSPGPQASNRSIDLAALLHGHCATLAQAAGANGQPPFLQVTLETPHSLELPEALANELFHLAREALHNAGKHSGVGQAACRLAREAEWIVLEVSDRGKGFDPQAVGAAGYGLRGMRERAARLGGEIFIMAAPGDGTHLTIRVPEAAVADPHGTHSRSG